MQENKSSFITNGKEKIKCGSCGNEETFVLISESLDSINSKKHQKDFQKETQITEKQKYLAHYIEAQLRFGE